MDQDQSNYLIELWEMLCDKHTIENAWIGRLIDTLYQLVLQERALLYHYILQSVCYECQYHSQKSGIRQSAGRATELEQVTLIITSLPVTI